jgi:hypothetical protein
MRGWRANVKLVDACVMGDSAWRAMRARVSIMRKQPSCWSGWVGCRTGDAGGAPHARMGTDLPRARVRGTLGVARRAGLLACGSSGPGQPSRLAAVAWRSGVLAGYSGGPAPDSHRLPYSPPRSASGGGTCREDVLQASDLRESSPGRARPTRRGPARVSSGRPPGPARSPNRPGRGPDPSPPGVTSQFSFLVPDRPFSLAMAPWPVDRSASSAISDPRAPSLVPAPRAE